MAIGSTRRTSGLIIPSEWEEEFKETHPRNREREKELFEKLKRAMDKLKEKDNNLVVTAETTEVKFGGTERI
jgi:hypothetical protein